MSGAADAAAGGVAARLADVRRRIAEAARRAGRDPADVTLVGVSKRVPVPRIRAALEAGLRDLGENYVQEAAPKIAALADATPPPRWHMVGGLQSNKAKEAVRLFQLVESVDRASLAQALSRRAAAAGRRLPVLLQVNLSGETQKSGCPEEALPELLALCAELEGLEVRGLMTVPAAADDPEASRPAFARLRALRARLRAEPGGEGLEALSMGMSADFEVAVEEGATLVRVGTALFGPRPD